MLYKDIDIYEARVEEEHEGIFAISLVEYPAVESNFMCFKDDKELVKFSIQDEDQHLISGVIMLADSPIYRRNGDYQYYIIYSKDTIKKMAQKMLSDGTFNNIDLQHDGQMIPGVQLVEIFIKDSSKGLNPNYVNNIPDGSLMGTFHIEDDTLWDEIKNGDKLKGFSLEGYFTIEKMQNNKITNINMSKISKLVKNLMKFAEIETSNGKLYWNDGDLELGVEVYVEDENGEKIAAQDGEYEADEKTIVITDGKVSEIRIKEEKEDEPRDEEIIEVSASKQKFNQMKALFEESYEKKEAKIADAIRAKGFDAWVIEAGDDYAIAEIWVEESMDYKHYRFPVSWDEEGKPIVGDPEEVRSEFVPVEEKEEPAQEEETIEVKAEEDVIVEEQPAPEERDEKDERIEKLEGEVEALKAEIESIKSTLSEIVTKPVAEPIVEEFSHAVASQDWGKNKAARLLSNLNK